MKRVCVLFLYLFCVLPAFAGSATISVSENWSPKAIPFVVSGCQNADVFVDSTFSLCVDSVEVDGVPLKPNDGFIRPNFGPNVYKMQRLSTEMYVFTLPYVNGLVAREDASNEDIVLRRYVFPSVFSKLVIRYHCIFGGFKKSPEMVLNVLREESPHQP
jgi:hypothetical protein